MKDTNIHVHEFLNVFQELCDHLIFYKEYDSRIVESDSPKTGSSTYGIVCYAKLPQKRCDRLKTVTA